MLSTIKNVLFAAAVLVQAALTTNAAVAQSAENFTIRNESSYRIDHVYVAPSSSTRWGQDRLIGYLDPAQRLDLPVAYGTYDVMVVDAGGGRCVIKGINMIEDETWHLTDARLISCEFSSL